MTEPGSRSVSRRVLGVTFLVNHPHRRGSWGPQSAHDAYLSVVDRASCGSTRESRIDLQQVGVDPASPSNRRMREILRSTAESVTPSCSAISRRVSAAASADTVRQRSGVSSLRHSGVGSSAVAPRCKDTHLSSASHTSAGWAVGNRGVIQFALRTIASWGSSDRNKTQIPIRG